MARAKKLEPTETDARVQALNELGLSSEAQDDDIRSAFRLKLKGAHPDVNGGDDVLLRRLILARDLLINDQALRSQGTGLLQDFQHTDEPVRLDITLTQAIFGGEASTDVPALEVSSASDTVTSLTQTRRLAVPLRPGLRNGDVVNVPTPSAARAIQSFRIHILTEDGVRVWGDDIWMVAAIDPGTLASGGEASLATPHGHRAVILEPNTSPGASLQLKGLGLPATTSREAGDLNIRLNAAISTPVAFGTALGAFRARWVSAA